MRWGWENELYGLVSWSILCVHGISQNSHNKFRLLFQALGAFFFEKENRIKLDHSEHGTYTPEPTIWQINWMKHTVNKAPLIWKIKYLRVGCMCEWACVHVSNLATIRSTFANVLAFSAFSNDNNRTQEWDREEKEKRSSQIPEISRSLSLSFFLRKREHIEQRLANRYVAEPLFINNSNCAKLISLVNISRNPFNIRSNMRSLFAWFDFPHHYILSLDYKIPFRFQWIRNFCPRFIHWAL